MGEYSKFIDSARRAAPAPPALIDADGKAVFGTFDGEFESMDLVKTKKPTHLPQAFNKLKLTLWEAAEVFLEHGILLAAVCDMGIFGKTLCIFFDKRTRKVYCWDNNLKSKETYIAPNLLNGSVSEAKTHVSRVKYVNNFEKGECGMEGAHNGADGETTYSFKLKKLAPPSVVSIPFGPNRPLYTEKEFFKVDGTLIINGEEMRADKNTCAVVDDHRGFYPRRCHYDWLTTMGRYNLDGEEKYFAFNLTYNQSLHHAKYNEDLIWFENQTSILPPVEFTRDIPTKDFKDTAVWYVKDKHDMVNVKFTVRGVNPMIVHALVVNIDYFVAFGELEGYLRDEDGNKIILDGMPAMGEDKTLLL